MHPTGFKSENFGDKNMLSRRHLAASSHNNSLQLTDGRVPQVSFPILVLV